MNRQDPANPQTELNRILEIIGKIAKISAAGSYIYRGEPKCYDKVSSTLYRKLEAAKMLHLNILKFGQYCKIMLPCPKAPYHLVEKQCEYSVSLFFL